MRSEGSGVRIPPGAPLAIGHKCFGASLESPRSRVARTQATPRRGTPAQFVGALAIVCCSSLGDRCPCDGVSARDSGWDEIGTLLGQRWDSRFLSQPNSSNGHCDANRGQRVFSHVSPRNLESQPCRVASAHTRVIATQSTSHSDQQGTSVVYAQPAQGERRQSLGRMSFKRWGGRPAAPEASSRSFPCTVDSAVRRRTPCPVNLAFHFLPVARTNSQPITSRPAP